MSFGKKGGRKLLRTLQSFIENMGYFVISSVPADSLALSGAWTYAGTVMT